MTESSQAAPFHPLALAYPKGLLDSCRETPHRFNGSFSAPTGCPNGRVPSHVYKWSFWDTVLISLHNAQLHATHISDRSLNLYTSAVSHGSGEAKGSHFRYNSNKKFHIDVCPTKLKNLEHERYYVHIFARSPFCCSKNPSRTAWTLASLNSSVPRSFLRSAGMSSFHSRSILLRSVNSVPSGRERLLHMARHTVVLFCGVSRMRSRPV